MKTAEAIHYAKVRFDLARTQGAFLCLLGNCEVITQGGQRGLNLHRQVVHEGEIWASKEDEGSMSRDHVDQVGRTLDQRNLLISALADDRRLTDSGYDFVGNKVVSSCTKLPVSATK